jgi:O-antigen biosynthesis protein
VSGVGVVVATCRRPAELHACLGSLLAQTLPPDRIVVVDDAPGADATWRVVTGCDPGHAIVDYVAGEGRGLAAAHNRGLREIATPIVAFTDDDVVAEPDWLERISAAFARSDRVGCVTGRIRPFELSTTAQRWLDGYAGFDKGLEWRVFDLGAHRPDDPLFPFTAGTVGSGANMAFSREALAAIGGFDAALGAGTRARGGDDLAAFFEVLQHGFQLVYEPAAVVRHRHAQDLDALERQVHGYGVGLTAYLTSCLVRRPRLLGSLVRLAPRGIRHALSASSPKNARLPDGYPPRLARLERRGMLAGPFAYLQSRYAQGSAR